MQKPHRKKREKVQQLTAYYKEEKGKKQENNQGRFQVFLLF